MATLANIQNDIVQTLIGNACFTYADVSITSGGSAPTFDTATAVNFVLDGVYYVQASAVSAGTFSSGHTALSAGEKCFFALCINSALATSTVQGPIFKTATINGVSNYVDKQFDAAIAQSATNPYPPGAKASTVTGPFLPVVSDSLVPYALIKVEGAFTPGTTDLDDAGITTTYYNLARMPSDASNL